MTPRIVCYGDSNTFGYDGRDTVGGRLPAGARWVDLLGGMLGCECLNCGLNGRTVPYYERSVKADLALLRRQAPCTLVIVAFITTVSQFDYTGSVLLLNGNEFDILVYRHSSFKKSIPSKACPVNTSWSSADPSSALN